MTHGMTILQLCALYIGLFVVVHALKWRYFKLQSEI